MATTIGDLAVRVGADTTGLVKGLKESRSRLDQFGSDVKAGASTLAKYGAAATAAGAALAALAAKSIQANKETANLAKLANTSVNTFSKMSFAAKSVGIEQEKLADILKDTSDRVGDFLTTGGGPMADFFERIAPKVGVTAEQFRKLSGPQALQLYVDSLEKANVSQNEMTFFMEAMASDATALLPLLRNGGEAMAAQAAQAERLGVALSNVQSEQIEQAAIQMDRAQKIITGFTDQFTARLAPVIEALGKQFIGLAEDTGGVGDAAAKSFNVVVDAVATVANAFDALDRVLLESQTAVDTFALAFRVGLLEIAREIVEIPTAAVNEMIMAVNNIPGVDIDLLGMSDMGRAVQNQIDSTKAEIATLNAELNEELSKPLAGDTFKRLVADAEEASKKSAAAMVEVRQSMGLGGGTDGTGNAKDDQQKEQLESQLQRIREANMTELELQQEKFAQENEQLNAALEQQLITRQEWAELSRQQKEREEAALTEIEQQASDERKKLAEQEQKAKLQGFANMFSNLSTLMNTESRKMFEIGKAAALAGAIVDGYAAITGAYAQGAKIGGPPLGAAFGAAAAAATFAQIQNIRSASFGGGGSGSSTGGSSVTQGINNQGEAVRGQASGGQTLTLQGVDPNSLFTGRQLIETINQAQKDGAILQVQQ